jgi:hypothetical protein
MYVIAKHISEWKYHDVLIKWLTRMVKMTNNKL